MIYKDKERCQAEIYKRDTYRVNRSGRGSHFKMHYTQDQCSRKPKYAGFCWQHKPKEVS